MASTARVFLAGPTRTVVFPAADAPEALPLGGSLVYAEEILSDGTRRLQITGYTPTAIQISGAFIGVDEFGASALDKMDFLEAMAAGGALLTFTWYDRSWPVTLVSFTPRIVRAGDVEYSLVLHRAVA